MKGAVAETLAEARKIGTGIMFTLHGQEVYRKHAEELAKEPDIRNGRHSKQGSRRLEEKQAEEPGLI
jgi:hypothetical protein